MWHRCRIFAFQRTAVSRPKCKGHLAATSCLGCQCIRIPFVVDSVVGFWNLRCWQGDQGTRKHLKATMASYESQQSDLLELRRKAGQVADESLESTRRMVGMMEESKEAGIRTLVALDDQGEQLDRIEEGMDRINADMREAEKNLSGMEKCCGLCSMPWKNISFRGGGSGGEANSWKTTDNANGKEGAVVDHQPLRSGGSDERDHHQNGGYVTRILNDAREDEMDENLGQVDNMLGNLRNMALDMGSEIENQNKQIDRINAKSDANNARMDGVNKRANILLKN